LNTLVKNRFFPLLILIIAFLSTLSTQSYAQCDSTTPEFIVDLSSNPDSIWIETNTSRLDSCCFQEDADPCISFVVTLAASTGALYFSVENPQPNISSAQFHINCDTTVFSVQDTVCVAGYTSPYTITYCKPGNDQPDYVIAGIGSGDISPPITVSEACSDTLWAEGFVDSTIVWTSIPSDSTLESFLDCPTGCDTVIVTPTGVFPDSIQYKVCGQLSGTGCVAQAKCDSTWVYFLTSLDVQIVPQNPTICFGGSGVTLNTAAVGGVPPYSYLWSTGSTDDSIVVTTGNAGVYWVSITDSSGCPSANDTVTVVEFDTVITADAGPDTGLCLVSSSISLSGTVTGVTTGQWSWGLGTYAPSPDSLNMTYTPTAGEISAGTVSLLLTTTNTGSCPADSDTIVITMDSIPATANAGPDQVLCGLTSTTLAGSDPSPGTGIWNVIFGISVPTTPTSPISVLTGLTIGNQDTLTWTTSNGVCAASVDTVVITVDVPATVSAGPDDTICDGSTYTLSGSFGGTASSITWSTTGTGTFDNVNLTNATYAPSAADITAGTVDLVITSDDPAGPCGVATDTITLIIDAVAIVSAGTDDTICDGSTYTLSGSFGGTASSITWSTTGTGTFDNSSLVNATYTPSPADIAAGSVDLVISSDDPAGPCGVITDTMNLTINPFALVSANVDDTICEGSTYTLSGTVGGGASSVTWTTTGSGTFDNTTLLTATYTPSAADILAGSVILIITTDDPLGPCVAAVDSMVLTINLLATVSAGVDDTICGPSYTLSGSFGGGTSSITWSTSGTGTFDDSSLVNATYTPSPADISSGSTDLAITSVWRQSMT